MVRPACQFRHPRTPIEARPQAHPNSGAPPDWAHAAHDLRRSERAVIVLEAGCEIGDFDRASLCVLEHGDEHRRVLDIALRTTDAANELDAEVSARSFR